MNEEKIKKNWNKKNIYNNPARKRVYKTPIKKLSIEDFIFEDSQHASHRRFNQEAIASSIDKDIRIKELEEEIADLKAEIEMLKAVNQEC